EEGAELALVAGDLDHQGGRADVDDLRAEDVGDLHDLGARLGIGGDLDQAELAGDVVAVLEVEDLDDVDQLVELLDALVDLAVIAADGGGDAGKAGIVGRTYVQRIDVEAAAGEHAGDAGKDAEFIFDEDADRMSHGRKKNPP